jgi:hypothetical protein
MANDLTGKRFYENEPTIRDWIDGTGIDGITRACAGWRAGRETGSAGGGSCQNIEHGKISDVALRQRNDVTLLRDRHPCEAEETGFH